VFELLVQHKAWVLPLDAAAWYCCCCWVGHHSRLGLDLNAHTRAQGGVTVGQGVWGGVWGGWGEEGRSGAGKIVLMRGSVCVCDWVVAMHTQGPRGEYPGGSSSGVGWVGGVGWGGVGWGGGSWEGEGGEVGRREIVLVRRGRGA